MNGGEREGELDNEKVAAVGRKKSERDNLSCE